MKLPERRRPTIGEPIVPLINVVFLLLVFLMMSSAPDLPDPWNIDPAFSESENEDRQNPPALYMSASGDMAYGPANGEAAVFLAISRDVRNRTLAILRIKADKQLDTTELLSVISKAKAHGVKSILLVTRRQHDASR